MKKLVFVFLLIAVFGGPKSPGYSAPSFTGHFNVSVNLQKGLGIKTEKARVKSAREVLALPGTVSPLPQNEHEIHSPVTGEVKGGARIPTVGDRVSKGRTLAIVRQTLTASEAVGIKTQAIRAQAALSESRNNLALKKIAYERAKKLYAIQIIALKDLQGAKTEYENARLQFDSARSQAKFYAKQGAYQDFRLLSPMTGIITTMNIAPGEIVDPQKALFKVVDLSKVWIQIHAYENDISKIYPGQKAIITSPALAGAAFYGRVKTVGVEIDPQSRTLPAAIELSNPGLLLKDGMLVRVRLLRTGPPALMIQESGIIRENGKNFVFKKSGETDFYREPVVIEKTENGETYIKEGVKPGDEIVVQGAYLLNSEWHKQKNGPSRPHEEDTD